MKYKGVAEIELKNTETGEIKKYEEHNKLTSLLDDIFNSGSYDGIMQFNDNIKYYLNNIVVLGGKVNEYNNTIDDNIEIIGTKKVDVNGKLYKDTGIEYTFNFEENECVGQIEGVSLSHSYFKNPTSEYHEENDLVSGTYSYSGKNYDEINIISIDIDNNIILSISSDDLSNYSAGSPFYVYIKKYYHNFKDIPLFDNTDISLELLETSAIDIQYMLNVENASYGHLFYAVDEYNKNIIISYIYGNNSNVFNTLTIKLDDISQIVFHNMVIPENINFLINYPENSKITPAPVYRGKLIFYCNYNDGFTNKKEFVGFDYLDSTNYIVYELENEINQETVTPYEQLLNIGNDTLVSKNLCIKNGKAYYNSHPNGNQTGFFYKSKVINIKSENKIVTFSYSICDYVLATINYMTRNIIKTNKETMKIIYRITQNEG